MQIVVFSLKDAFYAFRTEQIEEISKIRPVSRMPDAEPWIEGLVNLRGEIIVLANLEKLLGKEPSNDYNSFIIVKHGDAKVGILVKEVKEVTEIDVSRIEKLSDGDSGKVSGLIQMGDRIVNYLDIADLMDKRG